MMRALVKAALATGPGFRLRTRPASRARVAVLMYHRIARPDGVFGGLDPAIFAAQMQWIARHCDPIAPEALFDRLRRPSLRLPVLVTFDDGYRDYAENAWPVLQQLGIPALVFVATQPVDEGGLIWTDRVFAAFALSARTQVELPWLRAALPLRDAQERSHAVSCTKQYLKALGNERREECERELLDRLGAAAALAGLPRQMLTWQEIRATLPLTSYGGHTHTHPIISKLAPERLRHELAFSRDRIAAETGIAPRWFAYPNGRREDIPAGIGPLLQSLGYEAAFSTIEGLNDGAVDRWAIRRQPTEARHLRDFAWLVAA